MNEEQFKESVQKMLMMQNNNDHNFKILQYQIDELRKQIQDLNELREVFHLPPPENLNRKAFDEVD
tara:strand:+ start:2036 stop:2233 length:198 start_codon:yes stop_codon:yes gene_type:complete